MAQTPIVYSDLSYNPQLNNLGDLSNVNNLDAIKQAVKTIVLTPIGTKLFDPDFGSEALSTLFELSDDTTASDLESNISNALKKYETRITVNFVKVNILPNSNAMTIEISYLIQEIQEYDNVVISLSKL